MKRLFLLILFVICAVLIGSLLSAQETVNRPPAIVMFASDTPTVSMDAVEDGTATATLSWHVVHAVPGMRLVLDAFQLGEWVNMMDEDEVLQPSAERETEILAPYNYNPPMFRLQLLSEDDDVLDTMILTLPYTPLSAEEVPTITTFSSPVQTLDAAALTDGTARVEVTWAVINRPPLSNLVFEQVVDDEPVSVELPRDVYRVGSSGTGVTAPVAPATGEPVVLRLSLQDTVSGDVYASAEISIPVDNVPTLPQPTVQAQATATTSTPQTQPTQQTNVQPQILSFTTSADSAAAGSTLTVTWETQGIVGVTIREIRSDGQFGQFYNEQPASGSIEVTVPTGPSNITYQIVAAPAEGAELTLQRTVQITQ